MKNATLRQTIKILSRIDQFFPFNVFDIFKLIVDYDRSVETGVEIGKYDWVDNDITSKHFPSQETGISEITIEILHFNKNIKTDDVLKKMEKNGYRPATLKELLAFGGKYPDFQRKVPIIAFGSVWQNPLGERSCPCLNYFGLKRCLILYPIDLVWFDQFAAVHSLRDF